MRGGAMRGGAMRGGAMRGGSQCGEAGKVGEGPRSHRVDLIATQQTGERESVHSTQLTSMPAQVGTEAAETAATMLKCIMYHIDLLATKTNRFLLIAII